MSDIPVHFPSALLFNHVAIAKRHGAIRGLEDLKTRRLVDLGLEEVGDRVLRGGCSYVC